MRPLSWLLLQQVHLILGVTATKVFNQSLIAELQSNSSPDQLSSLLVHLSPSLLDRSCMLCCQLYSSVPLSLIRSVMLSHKIAVKKKKLAYLALLGSLHNASTYLLSISFGSSYMSYHKSGLLRKDFSGREDFHPYLMYLFWGRSLFSSLLPPFLRQVWPWAEVWKTKVSASNPKNSCVKVRTSLTQSTATGTEQS